MALNLGSQSGVRINVQHRVIPSCNKLKGCQWIINIVSGYHTVCCSDLQSPFLGVFRVESDQVGLLEIFRCPRPAMCVSAPPSIVECPARCTVPSDAYTSSCV